MKPPQCKRSTYGCMARIVTALIVCEKLTVTQLLDKSDVASYGTVNRAVRALLEEDLIERVYDPFDSRVVMYRWKGKA